MPGEGPWFDLAAPAHSYLWWYVDGVSDCGRYAVVIIAFVGSVFSPYYAWSGREDPENHVAINVALYSVNGNRWAMTERGRGALKRSRSEFRVGPSSLTWLGDELIIDFDETGPPFPPVQYRPMRLKGRIVLRPHGITDRVFDIDDLGGHRWWPIAPSADIEVTMEKGDVPSWKGHGYFDSNWGIEPVEKCFQRWEWARGTNSKGEPVMLYDALCLSGERKLLALRGKNSGGLEDWSPPERQKLKRGFWGVDRYVHCDEQATPTLVRPLEDSPFYTRSLVETRLGGEQLTMMHESFSGSRLASRLVKLMLPVRMPRRAKWLG